MVRWSWVPHEPYISCLGNIPAIRTSLRPGYLLLNEHWGTLNDGQREWLQCRISSDDVLWVAVRETWRLMVAKWYRFVWNEESLFCFVHRCNDCEPPWLLRETDEFRRENRREQEQLPESNLPRPSEDCWSGASLESSVRSTNPRAIRVSADVWWRNPQHVWGDSLLQNWWVSALKLTLLKTCLWNENVKYTRNRLHSRH